MPFFGNLSCAFSTDLKNSLPESASYLKHEQIPIAFGLEKLRLQIKFSDELTNADPIEDAWKLIDSVQRVETISFQASSIVSALF